MYFYIFRVDIHSIQIKIDNLLQLGQLSASEHLLCLTKGCSDFCFIQSAFFRISFFFSNLEVQNLLFILQKY